MDGQHNTRPTIFSELLAALSRHPEVLYCTSVHELTNIAVRLQQIEKEQD